jgi:hypothetical protein
MPLMAGILTTSISSGRIIARTGRYKIFPIMGMTLLVIGLGLMSRIDADTSIVVVDSYALIFGLGLGFNMQTLVLAIQNAVPPQDMGVATSSATFFRQMGGTLGTAVFLSVLFNSVPGKITEAFQKIAPTADFQAALKDPAVLADPANKVVVDLLKNPAAAASGAGATSDSSFINAMDPRLARPFIVGFADSISIVFLLATIVLAVAFVVVWFLPEEKLRTQSGIQARQSQEAAAAAAMGDGAAGESQAVENAEHAREEPVGERG